MPFFIREEKYCPTCGFPADECECLRPKEQEDEDILDEEYL